MQRFFSLITTVGYLHSDTRNSRNYSLFTGTFVGLYSTNVTNDARRNIPQAQKSFTRRNKNANIFLITSCHSMTLHAVSYVGIKHCRNAHISASDQLHTFKHIHTHTFVYIHTRTQYVDTYTHHTHTHIPWIQRFAKRRAVCGMRHKHRKYTEFVQYTIPKRFHILVLWILLDIRNSSAK